MLRHQTIALALFLSAGCELAGAPPAPEKLAATSPTATVAPAPAPAKPAASASAEPAPSQKPAPADLRILLRDDALGQARPAEFATRAGPRWGKERPRFKAAPAPVDTATATPARTTTPNTPPPAPIEIK